MQTVKVIVPAEPRRRDEYGSCAELHGAADFRRPMQEPAGSLVPARNYLLMACFTLAAVLTWSPAVSEETTWKAGAAALTITPTEPLWMAGYASRTRPAEGKSTELWAKALVLEDPAGQRALMITLDLVGIDRTLSTALCLEIERQHGLMRHQVGICTSHTHSGPVVGQNLAALHYMLVDANQQERINAYVLELKQRILTVVGRALDCLTDCQLTWGSGQAAFAVNRRNNPASDVPAMRTRGALRGPSDHDVPVLAIRDSSGRLKSVVFGYACHATVLDAYDWSGDYPGFAQQEIEAHHPGCIAMFFAGCGADQNPLPRRSVALAEHFGRHLASAVDTVLLTTHMEPIVGELVTTYREIELPFGSLPTADEIQQAATSSNQYERARAELLLAQLQQQPALETAYPYPVSVWRLGEQVDLVLLGGEVVVDYAIRLKAETRGPATWVAGYANDVMAYIPSRRVLNEGGYEGGGAMVYYGLPAAWAPNVEELIVAAARDSLETAKPAAGNVISTP